MFNTFDQTMLERLFDPSPPAGLWDLFWIAGAIVLGVVVNHFWFRRRLKKAVRAGISPFETRLEGLAAGIAATAILMGVTTTSLGFVWIGIGLLAALVLAALAHARTLAIGMAIALIVAIAATFAGLGRIFG